MKRKEEHRLSITRRGARFLKLMDAVFPPEQNHGVPWHHCIDLHVMQVMDRETCPVAQIVNVAGGDFYKACERAGIHVRDNRELQHAGILPYNIHVPQEPGRPRELALREAKWMIDYSALEAEKLQREIYARIAQRYREVPRHAAIAAA